MIREKKFEDATSLWAELTDIQMNSDPHDEIIWRGHANAKWDLIPTVLRPQFINKIEKSFGKSLTTVDQVWAEFVMLQGFVNSCDMAGAPIPNDSVKFRESYLQRESFLQYNSTNIRKWPKIELFEVMALAQLHGLPTRFLDWTANPYRAVCFAVSQALSEKKWKSEQEIAIFAFNKGPYRNSYCGEIRILHVGGSVSKNVVNQQGLFTIHPVLIEEKDPLVVESLETYLPDGHEIQKLTVPVSECVNLHELCFKFGFSVAQLFPTADGASMQVMQEISAILARQRITNRQ